MTLPDQDGLYGQIEEYIKIYRLTLLKGRSSSIFFVSTGKRPMFSNGGFSGLYRRLTMIYLAYNPYLNRGIPGVKPHRPHAVRDIVATYIIKQTGSFAAAAFAIQDVEATVRLHYARFLPEDKTHFVHDLIIKGLS